MYFGSRYSSGMFSSTHKNILSRSSVTLSYAFIATSGLVVLNTLNSASWIVCVESLESSSCMSLFVSVPFIVSDCKSFIPALRSPPLILAS